MKIKEQTIKELGGLKPKELLTIYDMILSLKDKMQKEQVEEPLSAYIRVREVH